ncbi:prophage maintenance system killer protein [Streptococcus pneumoniae]|nr:prophage maintenance system killer protein [Streptococcus pneumoniae]
MTIYLTEKQIEKINALAIQRYSPNEKIQTVSSSALYGNITSQDTKSKSEIYYPCFKE